MKNLDTKNEVDWQSELSQVLKEWNGQNNSNYVIISPDVDGLTSAAILNSIYPIKIIGIYTTTHLMLLDDHSKEDAKNALWLDHDISQEGIRCIGQHLVLHRTSDELPLRDKRSWNPNVWVQQSWEDSFKGMNGRSRDKYPYGTTHFLWDLVNRDLTPSPDQLAILAHADGTWFALDCYVINAKIWKDIMFQHSSWVDYLLDYRNQVNFHDRHRKISNRLYEIGFRSQSRSSKSQNLPDELKILVGRQSLTTRIMYKPKQYLSEITEGLKLIGEIIGSSPTIGTEAQNLISGVREVSYPNRIQNFDKFMLDEKIFSHAFTDLRSVSYTVNLQL